MSVTPVLNKFRLIGGPHIAKDITAEKVPNKAGQLDYPVRKFEAPAIVVSSEDLMKRFPNKFLFDGPYGSVSVPTAPSAPPPQKDAPPVKESMYSKEDLEAFTVVDLRKLAEEEEIDVLNLTKKEQIIEKILASI